MRNKIVVFLSNRIVRNLAFMFTAWMAGYWLIESDYLTYNSRYNVDKEHLQLSFFWLVASVLINPFYDLWQKK